MRQKALPSGQILSVERRRKSFGRMIVGGFDGEFFDADVSKLDVIIVAQKPDVAPIADHAGMLFLGLLLPRPFGGRGFNCIENVVGDVSRPRLLSHRAGSHCR